MATEGERVLVGGCAFSTFVEGKKLTPSSEPKGRMTLMQEIIAKDFKGKIPSKKHIVGKFIPAIEIFEDKKAIFFRKVSRASNGTMLYCVPPTKEDFARENLIFHLKRLLQAKQKT